MQWGMLETVRLFDAEPLLFFCLKKAFRNGDGRQLQGRSGHFSTAEHLIVKRLRHHLISDR